MTGPTLPPLPAERMDAIESAVFGRIADERHRVRRRRRAIWTGVGAAASLVVVAAVVGPALTSTQSAGGSSAVGVSGAESAPGFQEQFDPGSIVVVPEQVQPVPGQDAAGSSAVPEGSATRDAGARDIVATGSSTVQVDDVAGAMDAISAAAAAVGGYIESSQLGDGVVGIPFEGSSTTPDPSSGWITVRVPAESLTQVMDGLREVGEVTATSVNRSDVTQQTVDLRARVAAGEASVARLTELMAQAASVSDLITAESALAERQAQLDSDRQVLQSLESQVAMSSLSVQVDARTVSVTADPAGFGDGLAAGWNGLIATLNGVVIGLGFLLPWMVVAGLVGAIVWGVRRAMRRRRDARAG
ncbi:MULTISPECIES: DUF4349 domain-containing protein [Microbacterium]|uniref:DUF4349 domain-containing protein n=1 Tax=Microbacterium TaxID=33882 RepID=UPI002783F362|nr:MULTISPECIES: DUF4349 domain-containing protein [Microbacterium]MDQ1083965.1 hypothetical protein [Microbacterium sp. SORGH_AS_0344]MDQ1170755.1 hypothetical protein [Microbacterium proteolyticum]